jgi:competence protein ComGC
MYKHKASDKKERSLAEIVIIVVLLAILMMSFIHYFFKQEEQLKQVGFNRITQSFATKITAVHAQWFMDKQPNIVKAVYGNKIQPITVNSNGWIDTEDDELACAKIWDIVIMEPMTLMKMPIAAVEVKKHNMDTGRICQFELPLGEYFQYNSQNGKVSGILSRSNEP